jgi:hypothetical protein
VLQPVTRHAQRTRHIVIRGVSGSTIFFPHYLTNGTIFGRGGGGVTLEYKMCVLIFFTTLV